MSVRNRAENRDRRPVEQFARRCGGSVDHGPDDVGTDPIARSIVAGYFPVEETQVALETDGLRRALVVAKYERLGDMYGIDWTEEGDALSGVTGGILGSRPLKRSTADAEAANQVLANKLSVEIATDLNATYGANATAGAISSDVSTGRATIVIRTW